MATNSHQLLLILTLSTLVIWNYVAADELPFPPPRPPYECPFPCLPPPVAPTWSCPPSPPTFHALPSPPPPPSSSSSIHYPPPPFEWFYPPSDGYYPFYPQPDYVNYYNAPPPPNPILPYFPFYYKSPPPPNEFSFAARLSPLKAWYIFFIARVIYGLYHVIME